MKVSSSQCAMMVAAVVTSVFIFFSYGYSRGWLMQRCSSNGDHFSDPHPADAHNPPGAPNLPGAERHGAFYNNSEIATDEEDWSTKRCPLKPLKNVDELFKYITSCTLACQKPVMVGGSVHPDNGYFLGEKWVCMSHKFNIKYGKCLAYSFGISRDFTFDDDMDKRFNCKVTAFDHTINLETHNRSENIQFFNLGISNITHTHNNIIRLDRYVNILKIMGHEATVIDYLKADVEGSEIPMLTDIINNTPNLLKNVKQIGVEVHLERKLYGEYWKIFQQLECYGFQLWFSEMNPVRKLFFKVKGKIRSCCYEMVWARDRQW